MPSRVERFLAHLDQLSGGTEPLFFPVQSTKPGPSRITAIAYRDLPEEGLLTALTYGLSLAGHPEWRHGAPELCLSVRSEDVIWARSLSWIMRARRNTRDVERLIQHSEAHITWALIRVMARRLAQDRVQPETYPPALSFAA